MQEQNLLEMILKEESWENLIYNIVSYEDLDPWDIDIMKLTNSFLIYIEKMKSLDFRVPAKVVLIAAILLKMKSDILSPIKAEGMSYLPDGITTQEFEQISEELSKMTLKPPVERHFKRKVTLDELIDALNKAMKVKEKKETIKRKLGRRIKDQIVDEVDIEIRINELMSEIDSLISKLNSEKIEFSKIVEEWDREEIVKHFMPLLYLATRGSVVAEQEDFFKEIYISKQENVNLNK